VHARSARSHQQQSQTPPRAGKRQFVPGSDVKARCNRGARATSRLRYCSRLAVTACATEQHEHMQGLRSLFAVGWPREPARAARLSAGCSPGAVRVRFGRVVASPCSWRSRQAGASWKEAPPSVLETTLSSSSIPAYTQSTERQYAMLPNPSIERTSTGLARSTSLVYVSLRGPSQWRPAHVKR
jgi:hypothetical protein